MKKLLAVIALALSVSSCKPPQPTVKQKKFQVTDVVCAWGQFTGVVINATWMEAGEGEQVIRYWVRFPSNRMEDGYYLETELAPGRCDLTI